MILLATWSYLNVSSEMKVFFFFYVNCQMKDRVKLIFLKLILVQNYV